MTAPSPYQVRSFLAPCLHQPCTEYARQSGGLCSEHAGFTYHQPAESAAVVPALERTKSEGRAKKERTKCEYSPVFTYEKMQKMPEADMLQFYVRKGAGVGVCGKRVKRVKRTCCRCKFIVRERNARFCRHAYS